MNHARRALVQRLQLLEKAGVTQIALVAGSDSASQSASGGQPEAVVASEPVHQESSNTPAGDTMATSHKKLSLKQRREQLAILSDKVAACTRCEELVEHRTQTVFGVGNPRARLCFFGEAPGADEDRQGEPFVGRAGQLLDRIIEACTLRREDIYILNVLKCRPPGNRNPSSTEASNCREFYQQQLDIIRPEFICCLGTVAAQTLLETTETIGRLRGKFFDVRGSRVMATYHPAYLLRNPPAKSEVWKDMQILMAEMGVELPKKGM